MWKKTEETNRGVRILRSGYTTGTCAAAAAKAAAVSMLTGNMEKEVQVRMPDGTSSYWTPVMADEPGFSGFWKVKKDSGDDPDVTNGVWVYARVTLIGEAKLSLLRCSGSGYWLEEYPNLYLDGGAGIGRVTKQGLSCPAGHYAINPVPRGMILSAVDEVCRKTGCEDGLLVEVAIPKGAELAEKTFNPRLGIVGGISVLGTTGIVRPMSEEALAQTIRLDIHMKALDGRGLLVMTPGNYGERFLKDRLGVPLGEAVVCSNFVADAVDMVKGAGVRRLLFVGHIGKLAKVASGARNTHSRYGDMRMETMEAMAKKALEQGEGTGQDHDLVQSLCRQVRLANTTEEAIGILKQYHLEAPVLAETAYAVKRQIEQWGNRDLETEVVVFSSAHEVMGMTPQAVGFLRQWKQYPG